jgi:hypothetical protein
MWKRNVGWSSQKYREPEKQVFKSSRDFINHLNNIKIDLNNFHIQLSNKVLTHITYLSFIVEEGKKYFGAETIEQAASAHKQFEKQLIDLIANLKLKSDEQPQQQVEKTTLKLVKN